MKIYPSKLKIKETDRPKIGDIPLAYVKRDIIKNNFEIEKHIEKDSYRREGVFPYKAFDSVTDFVFDKNNNRVDISQQLHRIDNVYYYIPENSVEFDPARFSFRLKLKRDLKYNNIDRYNINVACTDIELSKKLTSVFGNSYRLGQSPGNIIINNKSLNYTDMFNTSFQKNDFVFIESPDGVNYKTNYNTDININLSEILEMNTNVWLSVDNLESIVESTQLVDYDKEEIIEDGNFEYLNTPFVLGENYLYKNKNYEIFGLKKVMDLENYTRDFGSEVFTRVNLFNNQIFKREPVMVLEKENKGHIIISHNSFFDQIDKNIKILYEIMMQIYCKSYMNTESRSGWISDHNVEENYKKEKIRRKHSAIKKEDLFRDDNRYMMDQSEIIGYEISDSNVKFDGFDYKNEAIFSKIKKTDPLIKSDEKVVMTNRNTIMKYESRDIYKLETQFDIYIKESNNKLILIINKFKSSELNCDSEYKAFDITDVNTDIYAYISKNGVIDVTTDKNKAEENFKIATIKCKHEEIINNHDIRKFGGGPNKISEVDDEFNLMDIGYLDGKPYRIGATLIVKIPEKYKPHHNLIESALNRHCQSGDLIIITYI